MSDPKILQLRFLFGMEGYGIYWAMLETMHQDTTGYINKEAIGGLSVAYGVTIERLSDIIKHCVKIDLFSECEHGNIYSKRMIEQKKELAESALHGLKGAENRWKNRGAIDTLPPTLKGSDGNPNADQIRLDQIRIDNNIQEIYDLYPSTDKNNNKRPTGKCSKDKDKILKLIKSIGFEQLKLRIEDYLKNCDRTKEWLKNFSVLLNNLPEIAVEVKLDKVKNSLENVKWI